MGVGHRTHIWSKVLCYKDLQSFFPISLKPLGKIHKQQPMKHGLRHGHLTRHWHGHVDTADVKSIGHKHCYIYVNLFKDGLKWKLKNIYKHLTWAIYVIRKGSTTRYHSIWPLFIIYY